MEYLGGLMVWLLVTAFAGATATAQSFAVENSVIGGGGGTSAGGQFGLTGTIGQPAAGPVMSGGDFSVESSFWNLYVAVQTPGAPLLTVTRAGANVQISWPAEAVGFVLEETGSLSGTVTWLNANATPEVVDGRYVVTLPVQAGQHFFRLRWPAE